MSNTKLPFTLDGNEGKEQLIKVVVIGESGSGKTNLIQRLVKNEFDERSPSTIGIDFAIYQFKFQNKLYTTQIWDTAGMERLGIVIFIIVPNYNCSYLFIRYRSSMTKIFYRDVYGAVLTFDITKREHFEALPGWLSELRSNVHRLNEERNNGNYKIADIPIILLGNKLDLANLRAINSTEAIQFAQRYYLLDYMETSAKNNINVEEAFHKLFKTIFQQKNDRLQDENLNISDKKSSKRNKPIRLTPDQYYLKQKMKIVKKDKKNSKCRC